MPETSALSAVLAAKAMVQLDPVKAREIFQDLISQPIVAPALLQAVVQGVAELPYDKPDIALADKLAKCFVNHFPESSFSEASFAEKVHDWIVAMSQTGHTRCTNLIAKVFDAVVREKRLEDGHSVDWNKLSPAEQKLCSEIMEHFRAFGCGAFLPTLRLLGRGTPPYTAWHSKVNETIHAITSRIAGLRGLLERVKNRLAGYSTPSRPETAL